MAHEIRSADRLVIAIVPDEAFRMSTLAERWPDGSVVPVRQLYTPAAWAKFTRRRAKLLAEHPDAAWYVRIEPGDLWAPPAEPLSMSLGIGAPGAGAPRVAHRRLVRARQGHSRGLPG